LLSLGVKWLVMVCTIAMALDHLQIGSRIVPLAFGILFGESCSHWRWRWDWDRRKW